MTNDFPRRNRIDQFVPAELAIWKAKQAVEEAGCHPLLTEAVILLGQAQDKVADYVEQEPQNEAKTVPVSTTFKGYLRANLKEGLEFRLVIKNSVDASPVFYIHPLNRNGSTLDYKIDGNTLECVSKVIVE